MAPPTPPVLLPSIDASVPPEQVVFDLHQSLERDPREERRARAAEALRGRVCDLRSSEDRWVLAWAVANLKPGQADFIAQEILEGAELVSWAVEDVASDVLMRLLEKCAGEPWTALASCKLLEEFDALAGQAAGLRVLTTVATHGPMACRKGLLRRSVTTCGVGEDALFKWPDLLVRLLQIDTPGLGQEVATLSQQEHGLGWRAPLALTRCSGDLQVLEAVLKANSEVFGVTSLPAQLKDNVSLAELAPHAAAALAPLSPFDRVLL